MTNHYIRDTLKDVLKHTHGLGIYEMVKITGEVDSTSIETVDEQKTVIFKGTMNTPVPEFVDATFGLSRMGVLDGYLKYPGFSDDDAKVNVIKQTRNGEEVPCEVEFISPEGTDAHYRFMLPEIINQQLKEIKFKGAAFDVELSPTAKNRSDLMYFNSVLSQFEGYFMPKTENGALYFYIGDNSGDRTKVLINNNVDGDINHDFKWPLDIVLKILRLGDNAMLSFAKGLLQIKVISEFGEYTYLLPSKN